MMKAYNPPPSPDVCPTYVCPDWWLQVYRCVINHRFGSNDQITSLFGVEMESQGPLLFCTGFKMSDQE